MGAGISAELGMATRFRLLRIRTKVALVLSLVFVIVTVLSFTMCVRTCFFYYHICIIGGGIGGLVDVDALYRPAIRLYGPSPTGWLPKFSHPSFYTAFIPMWCIAPFVFIPTFLLWRKDRPIPEGHCLKCGYNLTGNVSGKCSECGLSI